MQLHDRLGRSLLVALLFAVLVPITAHANYDGRATPVGAGCGGGACHGAAGAATGSLNVSISGPATLEVDEVATYTLTIPQTLAGGGFYVVDDLSPLPSSIGVVDANTQVTNGGLSHLNAFLSAPAGNIGQWVYNFSVTAPSLGGGAITLSFAGMAFDGDGVGRKDADDIWNVGTYVVGVVSAVPEPATGLLVSLGIGMLAMAGRRRKA